MPACEQIVPSPALWLAASTVHVAVWQGSRIVILVVVYTHWTLSGRWPVLFAHMGCYSESEPAIPQTNGSGNRATDRTKAQKPPANKESNLTTKTTTVMKEFVIIAALAIGIAVIPRRGEGKKKGKSKLVRLA